jgi:hypothetical protein
MLQNWFFAYACQLRKKTIRIFSSIRMVTSEFCLPWWNQSLGSQFVWKKTKATTKMWNKKNQTLLISLHLKNLSESLPNWNQNVWQKEIYSNCLLIKYVNEKGAVENFMNTVFTIIRCSKTFSQHSDGSFYPYSEKTQSITLFNMLVGLVWHWASVVRFLPW